MFYLACGGGSSGGGSGGSGRRGRGGGWGRGGGDAGVDQTAAGVETTVGIEDPAIPLTLGRTVEASTGSSTLRPHSPATKGSVHADLHPISQGCSEDDTK